MVIYSPNPNSKSFRVNGYELSRYMPEDFEEVLELLTYLWGTEKSNRERFIWKHHKNPFGKKPVGAVAKHDGKIIGFWGFIPVEWRIGNEILMMLNACDTVVHPEHRGKGLYFELLKQAMRDYGNEYRFFVSFTPNAMTSRLGLKTGWKPISTQEYLRHISFLNLAINKLSRRDKVSLEPGDFGEVIVSDTILAADISRISMANTYLANKICPNRTPGFLEWTHSNPISKHTYLYHQSESGIDAYLILRTSRIHAYIFDFGYEQDSLGVQKLISFVLKHGKFGSVSLLNAAATEELNPFLKSKHFHTFSRINRIRNRELENLLTFVRPTVENASEDDWFINGLDVRETDNWHITEICFD